MLSGTCIYVLTTFLWFCRPSWNPMSMYRRIGMLQHLGYHFFGISLQCIRVCYICRVYAGYMDVLMFSVVHFLYNFCVFMNNVTSCLCVVVLCIFFLIVFTSCFAYVVFLLNLLSWNARITTLLLNVLQCVTSYFLYHSFCITHCADAIYIVLLVLLSACFCGIYLFLQSM